jgi:S-adenosylmethionine:tRNA ribosyltransferase-isomerase
MRVSDFDFVLPPENIALRPAVPRESARLLEVKGNTLSDLRIADLPSRLRAGDVLVFNNTKVIPAALSGQRVGRLGTTPKIEALLHQRLDATRWKAFVKPAKKLIVGDHLRFGTLQAVVEAKGQDGEVTLAFAIAPTEFETALAASGRVPLPPYIESKRPQDAQDRADYQTIYAADPGAVAAPTAGLHFTENLMKRLQEVGIQQEFVTLHVGAGTFLPVKAEDTKDHHMHSEWGEVSAETSARLKQARAEGRRIIAVGTTSLRLLEASGLEPFAAATDIFITPGYHFRAVDGLITNFHLPKSTLFMLVSAFAGTDTMRAAYAHAIAQGYRFYSYGDASLLWPAA